MVQTTHIFNIIFQVLDKASANLNKITTQMTNVRKSTDAVSKSAQKSSKALLGLGLGLTFFLFGVQLQLKRLLRTGFQFFKEAQGETGKLIEQFNILRANIAAIAIAFFGILRTVFTLSLP